MVDVLTPRIPPIREPGHESQIGGGTRLNSDQPFVLGHRPALDGLRGLAFIAVLTTHTLPPLISGGIVGLEVFFVLCGFLITVLLLQEHRAAGSIKLRAFYLRRVVRILPALVVALLGCFLYDWLCSAPEQVAATRKDVLLILCNCYNWACASAPWHRSSMLIHCWSLSVEGQFYLAWPLILTSLLALRVRRRWILALLGLCIVIPTLLRRARWGSPLCFPRILVGTDMQIDMLCAGALLGALAVWGLLPRSRLARFLLQLAVPPAVVTLGYHYLFCEHLRGGYMYCTGFTLVALASTVLMAALITTRPWLVMWVLERRLFGWLGRISYGGYLWNWPISYRLFLLTSPRALASPWIKVSLCLALTLAAGALSHYCVEQPCLRWYARRSKARRPADASATTPPAPGTLAA